MPTDNVLVTFTAEKFNLRGLNTDEVESEITSRTEHISLDKIEDYYAFKDDPVAFL
jgi:hypothetical protein